MEAQVEASKAQALMIKILARVTRVATWAKGALTRYGRRWLLLWMKVREG